MATAIASAIDPHCGFAEAYAAMPALLEAVQQDSSDASDVRYRIVNAARIGEVVWSRRWPRP